MFIIIRSKSPQSRAMTVSFGNYGPDNFKGGETYFTSIYESSLMLTIDYEWQFWNRFGTLGFVVGSGLFFLKAMAFLKMEPTRDNRLGRSFIFLCFPIMDLLSIEQSIPMTRWWFLCRRWFRVLRFAEKREDNLDKWHGRWGGALAGQYGLVFHLI